VLDGHLNKILYHASILEIDNDRKVFTNHGLHMNGQGKEMLSNLRVSHTYSILEQKTDSPVILNWKKEQKFEGVNTVSNILDKDRGQITHEEQAIRDQEQKEDKLPSKRARKLPTTRHDDFLSVDINTNHQM
jgi:hypothetical protein